ncbi:MAG: sigma 54-interacting transcriptional regulator, partial [Candidatus Kapabacteria bacterium]|nr:sigma 54-interacting transcriptional regulator [Candidatus Kapabacteria bacterium]
DRLELIHQGQFAQLANQVKEDVTDLSPKTKVLLHSIEFNDPWDFEEVYSSMFDFVKAYPFKPETEEYYMNITTGTHVQQICAFLLTEAHFIPGRLLQLSPPKREDDTSDAGTYTVIDLDLSRYDVIAQRFSLQTQEILTFLKSGINTKNKSFNSLIEHIEKVAIASSAPILLMGPTGAGKSQLAKRIYQLKREQGRVGGAFVEVNCATLRGDAAMSTLFGHKKGAFTGAMNDREGLLRSADGGVLFLDEIGELGSDEQAMLLRALEEKCFYPVGADKEVFSDFQLIAGTNRDLRNDVAEQRFRDDLHARINLWSFDLPGLKQRPEDIEPNLEYELERFAEKNNLRARFNAEAKTLYLNYARSHNAEWSANFRDLNASVTRMATLSVGGRITEEIVHEEIQRLKKSWKNVPATSSTTLLGVYLNDDDIEKIDLFDALQLESVIRVCKQSKSLAEAGR